MLYALCLLLQQWAAPSAAEARTRPRNKPSDQVITEYADHLTALTWPVVQNIGFSGGTGLAAGLALKVRQFSGSQLLTAPDRCQMVHAVHNHMQALGRAVAVTMGTLFITLQASGHLQA